MPKANAKSWPLADAKARLSALVRAAQDGAPQSISVNGKRAAVVLGVEEFERLTQNRTGADLVARIRACPYPEALDALERPPLPVRVRDVDL